MTIEELKAYGADTDAGLQRCMNNESFYLRLVKIYDACRDASDAVDANGNVQTVLTSFAVAVSRQN